MTILDTHQLWLKAASWGSFMTNTDPGACMYGFGPNSGFQSPAHAEAVIDFVETRCVPIARSRSDAAERDADLAELADISETARAFIADAGSRPLH